MTVGKEVASRYDDDPAEPCSGVSTRVWVSATGSVVIGASEEVGVSHVVGEDVGVGRVWRVRRERME